MQLPAVHSFAGNCVVDSICDRRLSARRALPYSQRLLVEDDETRLRKALASEVKKGDPAGKVARGLARLQVHAAVADPGLIAAAKKCVATAARREGLAAEAARLEKKGQLREALQQCVLSCCISIRHIERLLQVLIGCACDHWPTEQVPVGS